MDLTLLSGVVRNRKQMAGAVSRASALFSEGSESPQAAETIGGKIWSYLGKNAICRKFKLRVHKFKFQWDLILHMSICLGSLLPFTVTGDRHYTWVPVVVWAFYNSLIVLGPRYANSVIPGFSKLQHNFKVTIEEFFSPVLLPVLSISFLLVALSLVVTGHRLGGPPLCFQPCGECLARWSNGIQMSELSEEQLRDYDPYRKGCGYANGKELLSYYTMAQISFLLFFTVVVAMSVCLGWKLAAEEMQEFRDGEEWLKKQDRRAFEMREEILKRFGSPASSIRPEGSAAWVLFGINAALSFALLGWHNWYVLPPSHTATLLIILNLATMILTLLILHLGFFGRLLALYKRNFLRVEYLTYLLSTMNESDLDYWWNCRNFVLNDDLSMDYDIGGLAVSVTFLISTLLFLTFCRQIYTEGFNQAILESPGGYCAYAVMYLVSCLIKLFTLATKTYEEQHRHVEVLQNLSNSLYHRSNTLGGTSGGAASGAPHHSAAGGGGPAAAGAGGGAGGVSLVHPGDGTPLMNPHLQAFHNDLSNWQVAEEEYLQLRDDGPIDIDESSSQDTEAGDTKALLDRPRKFSNVLSPRPKRGKGFGGEGGNSNANFMDAITNNVFTRSLFASGSTHQISSPGGSNPHGSAGGGGGSGGGGGILFANRSSSRDEATSPGGVERVNSSSRLMLDAPLESDIENPSSPAHTPTKTTQSNVTNHHHGGSSGNSNNNNNSSVPRPLSLVPVPTLQRAESSGATEGMRQTIAEIMSQIRKYDPYPCILGIPIMPTLFNHSKSYIFLVFLVMGGRSFVLCMKEIGWGGGSGGSAVAAAVVAN